MNIDAAYKRAVRVIGMPDNPYGNMITIYDAFTEGQLTNIASADIHLSATGVNTVKLTFYETNEHGHILTDLQHEPITGKTTIISERHEIDLTAYEV